MLAITASEQVSFYEPQGMFLVLCEYTQKGARACSPNTMPVKSVRALEPTVRGSTCSGGCEVTPPAAACAPGLPRLAPAPARTR